MRRDELNDLAAFAAVAEARSFVRAASQLGLSPSALSHAMTALETRLGVRLLARTTRSVRATEAGERLLRTVQPALADIKAELAALGELRDTPSGTVRITTSRHAAATALWPVLPDFLAAYPDVRVEITIDEALTDIVASGYDAGIRFDERVAKDMIAVRIGSRISSAVVGSPGYFERHPPPQTLQDLAKHRCINYRLATSGGLYPWEFEADGRPVQVRVDGPLVLNDGDLILAGALAGVGLAYLFEDQVSAAIADGRLIRVLEGWCWTAPGYYFYYPSRRQTPSALTALIAALRAKATAKPPA